MWTADLQKYTKQIKQTRQEEGGAAASAPPPHLFEGRPQAAPLVFVARVKVRCSCCLFVFIQTVFAVELALCKTLCLSTLRVLFFGCIDLNS